MSLFASSNTRAASTQCGFMEDHTAKLESGCGLQIPLLSGLTSARISINLRMTSGGAHRAQAKDNAGKCAGEVVWFHHLDGLAAAHHMKTQGVHIIRICSTFQQRSRDIWIAPAELQCKAKWRPKSNYCVLNPRVGGLIQSSHRIARRSRKEWNEGLITANHCANHWSKAILQLAGRFH